MGWGMQSIHYLRSIQSEDGEVVFPLDFDELIAHVASSL
jgi:hypothetical protein